MQRLILLLLVGALSGAVQAEIIKGRIAVVSSQAGTIQVDVAGEGEGAEAAKVVGTHEVALQLRYLQTLTEISVEKNSTIIFPLPIELMRYFLERGKAGPDTGE